MIRKPRLYFERGRWRVRKADTSGLKGHKLSSTRERNRLASAAAWLANLYS